MGAGTIVETRQLTKSFGKLKAVDRLDLNIREGVIHGFIGPNGAGKTTTIKMLVGAIRPNSGEGFIKGSPVGSVESRKKIGYSPERPSFYKDMTARDYLVHMAGLSAVSPKEAEDRADELLHWLELEDFWDVRVAGFSAGMKQRLSIAQAMAHRPELLVLDEPTANLDPGGRMSLLEKLKKLPREQKVTIFISSHILSELEYLIDTVTFIDKGKTIAENTVQEMKRGISLDRYVLKTTDNAAVMEELSSQVSSQEVWLGEDGTIHLSSADMDALQNLVLSAVLKKRIRITYFGEEQVRLEDVYRTTLHQEMDK